MNVYSVCYLLYPLAMEKKKEKKNSFYVMALIELLDFADIVDP